MDRDRSKAGVMAAEEADRLMVAAGRISAAMARLGQLRPLPQHWHEAELRSLISSLIAAGAELVADAAERLVARANELEADEHESDEHESELPEEEP